MLCALGVDRFVLWVWECFSVLCFQHSSCVTLNMKFEASLLHTHLAGGRCPHGQRTKEFPLICIENVCGQVW